MRKVGEYWYPDTEERLYRNHALFGDIEQFILPHLSGQRKYCVQAGGAAGVWPIEFSKHFEEVFTFEPNPVLWECLNANIADSEIDNITCTHKGLYSKSGYCQMVDVQSDNMGAWYIEMADEGVPVTTLDEAELPGCDLLQLDIEGAEIEALKGGKSMIATYRPVIVLEVKQTLRNFGQCPQDLWNYMGRIGYEKATRFHRDELWIPR